MRVGRRALVAVVTLCAVCCAVPALAQTSPAAPEDPPVAPAAADDPAGAARDASQNGPQMGAESARSGDALAPTNEGDPETPEPADDAAAGPPAREVSAPPREPWPAAAPPATADTVLLRRSERIYFGLSPGSFSESQGLGTSGTGASHLGVDTSFGLVAFGGGGWGFEHLDAARTLRVDLLGQGKLRVRREIHEDANATLDTDATGYELGVTVERAYGEYLHYLPAEAFAPVFVGAWGGVPGFSISIDRPAQEHVEATTTVAVPFELSVGVGLGRVYPIRGRIVLARMQQALLGEGVLDQAIPEAVALRIFSQWFADRDHMSLPFDSTEPYGWSYHRQLLAALQILADAELLQRPINLLTAYRLDRILLDENNVDRWVGWELRAGARAVKRFERQWFDGTQTELDGAAAFALEVRGEAIFNLTVDSDLQIAPSLGIALRADDVLENDLSGARRVQLASGPAIDATGAFIPDGRVVLDVPVVYRRYVYDDAQNLAGTWNLHTGASAGRRNSQNSVGLSLGAAYTIFSDASTGYTLGLDGGFGLVGDQFQYEIGIVAVLGFGTGKTFYTAPDQVGDVVPFDTSWIEVPPTVGAEPEEASP